MIQLLLDVQCSIELDLNILILTVQIQSIILHIITIKKPIARWVTDHAEQFRNSIDRQEIEVSRLDESIGTNSIKPEHYSLNIIMYINRITSILKKSAILAGIKGKENQH